MLWWTQAFARLIGVYWVAVKELLQHYHKRETPIFTIYPDLGS